MDTVSREVVHDEMKLQMSEGIAGPKPPPGGQREWRLLTQWVVARRIN